MFGDLGRLDSLKAPALLVGVGAMWAAHRNVASAIERMKASVGSSAERWKDATDEVERAEKIRTFVAIGAGGLGLWLLLRGS